MTELTLKIKVFATNMDGSRVFPRVEIDSRIMQMAIEEVTRFVANGIVPFNNSFIISDGVNKYKVFCV